MILHLNRNLRFFDFCAVTIGGALFNLTPAVIVRSSVYLVLRGFCMSQCMYILHVVCIFIPREHAISIHIHCGKKCVDVPVRFHIRCVLKYLSRFIRSVFVRCISFNQMSLQIPDL
uniref:Uncharacterized protein n=1 Tax=Globisporangium ultimum (strain ATCC 200006 / CBS 805.95 / DAOM BR144) TaxID=431595 RepID=K3X616_GLOUD